MPSVARPWPRLLHPEDAGDYVGGMRNLQYLIEAHGLKPVRQAKRNTVYDREDLDAAVNELKAAGSSPEANQKPKSKSRNAQFNL